MTRIVLAHSGSLATSVAIPWLADRYEAEVVVLTLDVGQGGELADVRERALAAGAVRAHVLDAREELVRDYVTPALQAGVLSAGRGPLAKPLAQALIAKRLVDVARMESASAVAHGGSQVAGTFPKKVAGTSRRGKKVAGTFSEKVPGTNGSANGSGLPSVLDEALRALDSTLTIIAPARLWTLTREQQLAYARARSVSVSPDGDDIFHVDANVWGRSIRADSQDDEHLELPEGLYTLTRSAKECPDEPAYLEIEFERGLPVRANGIEMPLLELIESLDIIAGAHGVGRIQLAKNLEDRRSRTAFEAPAAVLLHAAHRELEAHALPDDFNRMKQALSRAYADLVTVGQWVSPTRESIDAFVRTAQPHVTGSVRLKLFKGDCHVVNRRAGSVRRTASLQDNDAAAERLIS
jgi:argininosuccinate synthase